MIAVSVYRVLVWQAMDSAIAHLGEVCQATLRQSLYVNWTVVVSFFFIWRVFGFQAVDCGLRHWDSFLRFFTGAPQRNRSKGCLNCRSGTPSYPHTALDPATGGMWSWRWICEVNLKRCLDLESFFSQLYVIIDCRQLIIMIVHHMYIIVYTVLYDSIL